MVYTLLVIKHSLEEGGKYMKKVFNTHRIYLIMSLLIILAFISVKWPQKAFATGSSVQITNATATAASSNPAHLPADATNSSGNNDWWAANIQGESWLQLDLKHVYSINRWYVKHFGAFSNIDSSFDALNTKDFKLQSSMDGNQWTDIDIVSNNTSDVTDRYIAPFSARYVRIYIINPTQNTANTQYSCAAIVDFYVYAADLGISSVNKPVDKTYSKDEVLSFDVNYTADVIVDTTAGTPYIPLIIEAKEHQAYYVSGSGSRKLTFQYTVEGQWDNDGIDVGNISLNNGFLKDGLGRNAPTTLNTFLGDTSGIKVDGRVRYTVNVVNGTGSGNYVEGDNVNITANTAPEGQVFHQWTSTNAVTFQNTSASSTTFKMPPSAVTITANYITPPPVIVYTITIASALNGTTTCGGNYNSGTTVTLRAIPDSGYNFEGWFDGATKVSTLPNYTFIANGNITLTPKFTQMQKRNLTLAIVGSGSINLNVDQSPLQNISSNYTNEYSWGANFKLMAVPNQGYTFGYWMDGRTSAIISTSSTYEFILGEDMNIQAVFYQEITEASSFEVVFKDKNGKILKSSMVEKGQAAIPPPNPVVAGYNFVKWDKDYSNITSHMTIQAIYARKADSYTITVENGTLLAGGTTGEYQYDMSVTVVADTISGKKFSHWELNGQKVSIEPTYKFFAPMLNTTIKGIFVDVDIVVINRPFISISNNVTVENNTITYTALRSVPEGYTLMESGVVILNAAVLSGELTLATPGSIRGRIKNDSTDQFYMRKKNVKAGDNWFARAYLIYKDADGNIVTIYSMDTISTAIN